jgi:hypothetical protein
MNDNAWERLTDVIDAKFGIDNFTKRTEPLPDKPELKQEVTELFFAKGGDNYRLTKTTHPAIIDRKAIFSKTSTAQGYTTTYDPHELQNTVTLDKNVDGQWIKQDVDQLAA